MRMKQWTHNEFCIELKERKHKGKIESKIYELQ